jgi:hypothetical protein
MRGMLEPLAFAALLFLNYQAYRYGFGVGHLLGLSETTDLFLGGLSVLIANLFAGALTLAARAWGRPGRG